MKHDNAVNLDSKMRRSFGAPLFTAGYCKPGTIARDCIPTTSNPSRGMV